MTIQYVNKSKIALRSMADSKDDACKCVTTLLWGDPVHVPDTWTGSPEPIQVVARTRSGWVDGRDLSPQGLLEIYIIDVGQAESCLIRTPDNCWHLIDGGASFRDQMTRKGAIDFLHWKFIKDLKARRVTLKNVILTHPDDDHYGGLVDVFQGTTNDEIFPVAVENFYHNGLGRFARTPKLGTCVSGQVPAFPQGNHGIKQSGKFIIELLDGRDSFQNDPVRPFEKDFAEFAQLVTQVPQSVRRLSDKDCFLPGYEAGQNTTTIRVLGPLLENLGNGQLGLRYLQSQDDKTRNGHSVSLRIDYGQARILLAGDLNTEAQKLMLSYHPAAEFAVDVSKACHHGTDDVDMEFIRSIQARATVISSGDNEDYAHPRPLLMGAAGIYGRCSRGPKNEILPPLIYSTELVRSLKIALPGALQLEDGGTAKKDVDVSRAKLKLIERKAKYRSLAKVPCSSKLIYGLVNIRTDGKRILCATMKESGNDFDLKVFRAGVDV